MLPRSNGSFRLFRVFGITVFLHWSWFLVAAWQLDRRGDQYSHILWSVGEYLGLFLMVLLHEFGHALACRQVGGRADQIFLWPLGGVAYVAPPFRPGAHLWSTAAGPLVNVVLIPVFEGLPYLLHAAGVVNFEAYQLVGQLRFINIILIIFNLLPIYPLDGGQIVRELLWFPLGPVRSLSIAAVIGLVGSAALVGLAIYTMNLFMVIVALFILSQAWSGYQSARAAAAYLREQGISPR